MKLYFRVELKNLKFKSLDNINKDAYLIKIDFAGFIKLKFNISNNNTYQEEIFLYETLYANNLNVKLMTIKCIRRNWMNRQTVIAKYQIDLLSLATGTINYSIVLHPSSDLNLKNKKFLLNFDCIFAQVCAMMKHSISLSPFDNKYTYKCILKDPNTNATTDRNKNKNEYEYKCDNNNNNDDEEKRRNYYLEIDKSVLFLDNSIFQIERIKMEESAPVLKNPNSAEIVYSGKLLEFYNPKNCDKYLNTPFGKEMFHRGPIYHQMSSISRSNEEGVIYGHIFKNYPLPIKWAKNANLAIYHPNQNNSIVGQERKETSDLDIDIDRVHVSVFKSHDDKYNKMIKLIYLFFNKCIHDIYINRCNDDISEDNEKILLKLSRYQKELQNALIRINIKFGKPCLSHLIEK